MYAFLCIITVVVKSVVVKSLSYFGKALSDVAFSYSCFSSFESLELVRSLDIKGCGWCWGCSHHSSLASFPSSSCWWLESKRRDLNPCQTCQRIRGAFSVLGHLMGPQNKLSGTNEMAFGNRNLVLRRSWSYLTVRPNSEA